MGFPRQEHWSELPRLPPGDRPDTGIEPRSPALQADSVPPEPPGQLTEVASNVPYVEVLIKLESVSYLEIPQSHGICRVSVRDTGAPCPPQLPPSSGKARGLGRVAELQRGRGLADTLRDPSEDPGQLRVWAQPQAAPGVPATASRRAPGALTPNRLTRDGAMASPRAQGPCRPAHQTWLLSMALSQRHLLVRGDLGGNGLGSLLSPPFTLQGETASVTPGPETESTPKHHRAVREATLSHVTVPPGFCSVR